MPNRGSQPAPGASPAGGSPGRPTISTHVLDTGTGRPAVGVHVTLSKLADDGRALRMTQALTDDDGRIHDLLDRPLSPGTYRLEFNLGRGSEADERFFRRVSLDFAVEDTARSYHVPLLLAPYSVTSYRGS